MGGESSGGESSGGESSGGESSGGGDEVESRCLTALPIKSGTDLLYLHEDM